MNIGQLLKETRDRIDLTQEEMSPLVFISRSTISKLERNEMPIETLDFIRWLQVVQSKLQISNTTPLEAGITFINGVDIVVLTEMLTQVVSGFASFIRLLI